jgi:hypothetical protein
MLGDPELKELAEAEYLDLKDRRPALEREIRLMLLPRDIADDRSAILESPPAAGGTRPRSSPLSCSAPTSATPPGRAGASRCWSTTRATSAASRVLSPASRGVASSRS